MNDGLKNKHRQSIIDILAAHPGVERAVLFGSRAMETFTPTSDVDIALFGDTLTLTDQAKLAAAIDKLPIPQQVDLLRYRTIKNKKLLAHIRKHGVQWLSRGGTQKTLAGKTGRCSVMASKWPHVPVAKLIADGDLVINDGYRAKNAELSTRGLPFARAQNINEGFHFDGADRFPEEDLHKVGIKISQPCDVVFTSKGSVGRFALVRPDTPRFVYAPQLCFWRSTNPNRLDPLYLYYWMNSREFFIQFKGVSGQTDMAEYVSLRDQRAMQITVPDLQVQRQMAYVLGKLDDKIELNRRMNRTLEKMAAAIFKSWFIDFDPTHAKAERRDPGLPAEIAALFPDSSGESELGAIPTGWTVVLMKDLADVNARSIKKDYPHSRIRYVDISSVSQGSLDQTTTYDLADAPSRAKRLVQTGDTIWSCVRPNRKAYLYIDRSADNLVVSTGFAVLSPRVVPASYLHQWVTTQAFVDYLTAYATGAAYPAVKADTFETAKMILPSEGVLKAFHDLVGPLRARIAHNQRQNRRLAGLRDTLLPELLSGEIELPAAEELAEEVS